MMFRLLRLLMRFLMVVGGIVLIVYAVGWFKAARSAEERFTTLRTAKPICLPIDLSVPGRYSGRYEQASDAFPSPNMLRLIAVGSPSLEETQRALAGLSAEITLKDESGETQIEQVISAADFQQCGSAEEGLALDLALCGNRDYQLTVCVNEPAEKMAGHPHCLVGEYKLTERVEESTRVSARVHDIIGVLCLVVGMAIISLNGAFRSRTPRG